MPGISRYFFAVLFLTLAVFLPTNARATNTTDSQHELEQQTFFLINQYRKANKMPPFLWSETITKVARAHSKDMATGESDFGHDGFGDRVKQIRTTMVDLRGAGENVLKTDDPDEVAPHAVEVWLRSPHHLANVRGDFNYSGMGVWEDDHGVIYFTQIFVKIQPKAKTPEVTPPPQVVTPYGGLLAPPNTR